MSVIDTLITDRTQENVDEILGLLAAGENPADHKGAYNASDLNRVGEAIDYVNLRLHGIGIGNDADFAVSYVLPEETIVLTSGQDGEGTPSPENIRPIFPALRLPEIGEVYGGTLDVSSGVLTVTHKPVTIETAARTAYGTTGSGLKYLDIILRSSEYAVSNGQALCSEYSQISTSTTSSTGKFRLYRDSVTVYDSRFTSKNDAVATLTSEGFVTVYPLATAVSYQLTEQEMDDVARQIGNAVFTLRPEAMTKKDWTAADIPTISEMESYLSRVLLFRERLKSYRPDVTLPKSMRMLDFAGANQIEELLISAERIITNILLSYRGYSGRQISGVNCLP